MAIAHSAEECGGARARMGKWTIARARTRGGNDVDVSDAMDEERDD